MLGTWKLSLCIFLAVFTGNIEVYEFAQRSGSTILPNINAATVHLDSKAESLHKYLKYKVGSWQ